jgi:hypothetical protein
MGAAGGLVDTNFAAPVKRAIRTSLTLVDGGTVDDVVEIALPFYRASGPYIRRKPPDRGLNSGGFRTSPTKDSPKPDDGK